MILSAQTIRELCKEQQAETDERRGTHIPYRGPLVYPFHERTKHLGLTFGLSPCGYDVRIDKDIYLRAGAFMLAATMERFNMPTFLVGIVHDKSTWARRGLAVQNTVIEPGWRGFLTLEITNHGREHHALRQGMAIAQILFHELDETTDQPYPENGKYQDQPAGAQPAILELAEAL